MNFEVVVQPEAMVQIQDAFEFIRRESPDRADKWLQDLYRKINELESMPRRFSLARESDHFDIELRQMIFHSHRLIFCVEPDFVHVLQVRHVAQDSIDSES